MLRTMVNSQVVIAAARRKLRIDGEKLTAHVGRPSRGDEVVPNEWDVRRTRREEADGVELPEAGEVEVARLDGIALQEAVVIHLPELSPRSNSGVVDEAGLVGERVALDVSPEALANQSVTEDL